MVFIRTDANEVIASGHMMRCLSIAEELKDLREDVEFIISDHRSEELLKGSVFKYHILETDWRRLGSKKEMDALKALFSMHKHKDTKLLVDSYYVDNTYFLSLNSIVKTAYIDDLFCEQYDVKMLINYNIYYNIFDYNSRYSSRDIRLLLGTKYAPLRKQFKKSGFNNNKVKDKGSKLDILLMSGGGDPFHILRDSLKYGEENCLFSHNAFYHVVAGAYNQDKAELDCFEKRIYNLKIYDRVDDMASLMRKCNVAVSAAGTTLYECCAVGLPTILYCMIDNQKYDGLFFSKDVKMLYAGDLRYDREAVISSIYSHILFLAENMEARISMKENMLKYFDGYGAERIARELISL